MTFVEFTTTSNPKHYFIGRELADVLADTNDGRGFGLAKYNGYEVILEENARKLNLNLLDIGIKCIQEGRCKCNHEF